MWVLIFSVHLSEQWFVFIKWGIICQLENGKVVKNTSGHFGDFLIIPIVHLYSYIIQREQWVCGAGWNIYWRAWRRRNQLPQEVPLSSSSSSLSSSCSSSSSSSSSLPSSSLSSSGCREVEETGLLSESDRMLSKTILVPGANHAQVFP